MQAVAGVLDDHQLTCAGECNVVVADVVQVALGKQLVARTVTRCAASASRLTRVT
jgi:hypothetical protein